MILKVLMVIFTDIGMTVYIILPSNLLHALKGGSQVCGASPTHRGSGLWGSLITDLKTSCGMWCGLHTVDLLEPHINITAGNGTRNDVWKSPPPH